MSEKYNSQQTNIILETTRISLYLVILLVSLVNYISQPNFLNWELLSKFYLYLSLGFSIHLLLIPRLDNFYERKDLMTASFVIDALILNLLIGVSGQGQTFFVFLHMVNILMSGLLLQTKGALIVSISTAVFFNIEAVFGPEMKNIQFLFMVALNNLSFLAVAGLSGYLSDQLNLVGKELEKTGLSLENLQRLNSMIVENIPSALITFQSDGKVIQSNAQFERMIQFWNLPKNFFQNGRNIYDIFHLNLEKIETELGRHPVLKFEEKVSHEEDVYVFNVQISKFYSPLFKNNLFVALVEDLTQIRKMEYSLRQSEKLAAVGQLAAGIAHEIRNPLAGISGSIEMLSQTTSSDDDKKLMRIVLREIDRLNNLITEFLDYSKPEKPPTDPVNISQLLIEIVDSMKLNSKVRSDVKLDLQITPDLLILGRSEKLKQAFLNIVINAYQAMENIEQPILKVKIYSENSSVFVKIADTGCGIDETGIKKIFEPFHTTKAKGTGLGLAVTHKIFEGHGAKVFVESALKVGTEFIIQFSEFKK